MSDNAHTLDPALPLSTGVYLQHDQCVAAAVDGVVVAASEEERFTRVKHSNPPQSRSPVHAEQWLRTLGYGRADKLCFADPTHNPSASNQELFDYTTLRGVPFVFEHHLCHAATAYYWSGWEDCYILVIDGGGSHYYGLAAHGRDGKISTIAVDRMDNPRSVTNPGSIYLNMTHALGFKMLQDEGKIMCLAASGDPQRFRSAFSYDIQPFHVEDRRHLGAHRDNIWHPGDPKHLSATVNANVTSGQARADMAATTQVLFEEMIWTDVRAYVPRGARLAVAGGCFANVTMNRKLLDWVDDLFVVPPMHDGGLAAGAALLGQPRISRLQDVYLGLDVGAPKVDPRAVAEAIAAGAVVAVCAGRAELGPRALGDRSVLADPRKPETVARVNQMLGRDGFMPFAPVLLADHAPEVLEPAWEKAQHAAEFMTVAFAVRPGWVQCMPAVVHVDGTCRPQVLHEYVNPWYYAVVKEFYRATGVPCLLNTSFNLHGRPICNSAEHARDDFAGGAGDLLVLGDEPRLLRREDVQS